MVELLPDFGKKEVIFDGAALSIPIRLENERIEMIRPMVGYEPTILIDLEV